MKARLAAPIHKLIAPLPGLLASSHQNLFATHRKIEIAASARKHSVGHISNRNTFEGAIPFLPSENAASNALWFATHAKTGFAVTPTNHTIALFPVRNKIEGMPAILRRPFESLQRLMDSSGRDLPCPPPGRRAPAGSGNAAAAPGGASWRERTMLGASGEGGEASLC